MTFFSFPSRVKKSSANIWHSPQQVSWRIFRLSEKNHGSWDIRADSIRTNTTCWHWVRSMGAGFQCMMIHGDARREKGAAQLWHRLFKRRGMTFALLCAHWFRIWCSLLLILQHAHPLRCSHLRAAHIPGFYAHIVSWSVQRGLVSRQGKFGDLCFLEDQPSSVKSHLSRISPFFVMSLESESKY